MTGVNQWRFSCLIALLFFLLVASSRALASPNATITNGDVHLRESYPTYGVSTLFKFQLTPGASLAVVPRGTRVEVSAKKIIGKQEWFETTYISGTSKLKGWIYAGEVGNRRYVQLDPGVEDRLRVAAPTFETTKSKMWIAMIVGLLSAPAHAQPSRPPVVEPQVDTDPLRTLSLAVAQIVVFIGSLFVTKKWVFPTSNTYTFLTSISVLLMLGVISQNVWADLMAKWLAKGGAP